MSWFWRGAQSAFFYYVSCAPCYNYRFERKRAKEKAKAEKETKALMKYASRHGNGQIILPGEYDAVAQERITGLRAFTTNIYWQEERSLGPNPKRDKIKGSGGGGNLDTGNGKADRKGKGRGRGKTGSRLNDESQAATPGRDSMGKSSSDTLEPACFNGQYQETGGKLQRDDGSRDKTNHKRYQRPDEALWGEPHTELNWDYYARGRNPDINDLCPPIVSSRPASASQARWMLQPPPSAKVMEGKEMPLIRPVSAGAGSKSSIASRRNWTGIFREHGHRSDKILLSDLGERLTDLHEPMKEKRKPKFGMDGVCIEPTEFSDVYSTRTANPHESALPSEWGSPGSNISREKRPPPIITSLQSLSSNLLYDHREQELHPSWIFPRQSVQSEQVVHPSSIPGYNDPRLSGYSSEPEPGRACRVATQDLPRRHDTLRPNGNENEAAPRPSSKPISSASRPQSGSPSSSEQPSTHSSSTSLHALELELESNTLPTRKAKLLEHPRFTAI